jgi:DNA-binding NarL/FixJ family response regulator
MGINNKTQAKSVALYLLEGVPELVEAEQESNVFSIERISSMVDESIFIIDLKMRRLLFVANHDLFLCGHSPDEIKQLGYDFFYRIIHPNDWLFVKKMYLIVQERLISPDIDLDYFSFTVRIRNHSRHIDSDYLMVELKITLATITDSPHAIFCSLASSMSETSGILRYYSERRPLYEEYSFRSKKWNVRVIEKLNPQEEAILKFAKQGKKESDIAAIFHLSVGTLRNKKTKLYKKLHVKSIDQALSFTTIHRKMFDSAKHPKREESAYLSIENDDNRYSLERLTSIVTESIFIIDFAKQYFRFIAEHYLFLCGHSPNEIKQLGYDFFYRITHPDDLLLIKDVHKIISQRLSSPDDDLNNLDHFSFTFRIRHLPQFSKQSGYLMVYQKISPTTITGESQTVFCTMASSVVETPGHLRIYYQHSPVYKEYSFLRNKWNEPNLDELEQLTTMETLISKYTKQGKKPQEIADTLHVKCNTVRTKIKNITRKLHVHAMKDANTYSSNRRLIFVPEKHPPKKGDRINTSKNCDSHLTPASLMYIQKCLNNGQSVNSIAKALNCAEGTIRYNIKCGKVTKQDKSDS